MAFVLPCWILPSLTGHGFRLWTFLEYFLILNLINPFYFLSIQEWGLGMHSWIAQN